MNGSY